MDGASRDSRLQELVDPTETTGHEVRDAAPDRPICDAVERRRTWIVRIVIQHTSPASHCELSG